MRPAPKQWSVFLAVAFLVLVPCALFLPALTGSKLIYGLDLTLGVPFHAAIGQCLAAHEWPLWLNGVFGGMPGIASCNLAFLYPTDLVSYISGLPFTTEIGLDAAAHVALAGLGMFLFLRGLGRSLSGALLGSFFFAMAGSELSQVMGGSYNLVEGVAWVPWIFWTAHRAQTRGSLFWWGLCGLACALQILAVAVQILVYTLPAVALFVLGLARNPGPAPLHPKNGVKTALTGLALSLVLASLLAAPQLWLTLQYLSLTARHGYTYAGFIAGSIRPQEALTWLVPGLFGWQQPTYHGSLPLCVTSLYFGLLPWTLAAAALAALWRRDRMVRWMALLAPAAFFFAQREWTPFYALFQHVPVLSGFRDWNRVLFLVTFAVCSLAAYGWDALRDAPSRGSAARGAALFGVLALTATAFSWRLAKESADAAAPHMVWLSGGPQAVAEFLTAQARNSVLTTAGLLLAGAGLLWFSTRRLGSAAALVLALAFHGLDISSMVSHCVHFVDPQTAATLPNFTRPAPPPPGLEPWRVFDPNERIPNNDMLMGYENLGGSESMPMRSFLKIQEALQAVPGRWKDWADLMNVRYIFSHSQQTGYLSGDQVTIYENRGAFPRAWLVGKSVKVPGEDAAYGLLADPRFHARDEVALETDAGLDGPRPQGGVLWRARSPQSFTLDVSTARPAALVLSNAWYPSWRCAVDGRDAPVLKADGGLQAVLLRAGRHRMDFRFDPGLLYDALAASLAGLAALLGLFLREARVRAVRNLRRGERP
ncbi:MAG TPA: hypothetical protein VK914_06770 [bacterium]|jgi:hypothetical protein|nr:hypothetical protein [bacterium]